MADIRLSAEGTSILRRSIITHDSVTLPDEQLQRNLYTEIDKVLRNAGGKWNRFERAHIFQKDPREILSGVLANGKSLDPKKQIQAFDTPKEIAFRVIRMASILEGAQVLEPSAGLGMLALEARDAGGTVDCVEIDRERYEALTRLKGLRRIEHADFLEMIPQPLYERIVMNPPFSKKQDIKHVLHAVKCLRPDGRLSAIVQENHVEELAIRLAKNGNNRTIVKTSNIERGAFKSSGTDVPTAIVVIA